MCRPAAGCVKFAKTMRFATSSYCYDSLFYTLNISHRTFCTWSKLSNTQCTICKDYAVCQYHQLLFCTLNISHKTCCTCCTFHIAHVAHFAHVA